MLPTPERCCGCSACFAVCPKQAIAMKPDIEGFLQPVIDAALCVHCGLCEKACPVLHPGPSQTPLAVYAAKAKDDDLRMKSSSGGVFTLLAREILKQGGIVYGAGWEKPAWRVVHKSAENEEELDDLRGSKYVQSDMGDIFIAAREQLERGRHVLFTGCPCQADGLKRFLGHEYERLVCAEVICNSVPSPMALKALCTRDTCAHNGCNARIVFRDKNLGWRDNLTQRFRSQYHGLWQTGVTVRRSCLNCPSKSFRSGADLTIGDAWGIERFAPEMDDNRGVSVCFVNSEKGQAWYSRLTDALWSKPIDYSAAIASQPCVHGHLAVLERNVRRRESFFHGLMQDGSDFDSLSRRILRLSFPQRAVLFAGRCVRRMIRGSRTNLS